MHICPERRYDWNLRYTNGDRILCKPVPVYYIRSLRCSNFFLYSKWGGLVIHQYGVGYDVDACA